VDYNDATPAIIASSPGITANGEGGLGFPKLVFAQSLDSCAVVATTVDNAGTSIIRRSNTLTGTALQLAIKTDAGVAVRKDFDIVAVC
jgi:hypothetical protein